MGERSGLIVFRRFLRARRFDVNGAWGQFKDTEDWRKENAIKDLYENIEVEAYDAARRMVCFPRLTALSKWMSTDGESTPNGLAAVTAAAFPSTSSKSDT